MSVGESGSKDFSNSTSINFANMSASLDLVRLNLFLFFDEVVSAMENLQCLSIIQVSRDTAGIWEFKDSSSIHNSAFFPKMAQRREARREIEEEEEEDDEDTQDIVFLMRNSGPRRVCAGVDLVKQVFHHNIYMI